MSLELVSALLTIIIDCTRYFGEILQVRREIPPRRSTKVARYSSGAEGGGILNDLPGFLTRLSEMRQEFFIPPPPQKKPLDQCYPLCEILVGILAADLSGFLQVVSHSYK